MSDPSATIDFKALRKDRGFKTQEALAMKIGASVNTIIRVEKYGYKPGFILRSRLATVLKIEPTVLWPDHYRDLVVEAEETDDLSHANGRSVSHGSAERQ